MTELTLENIHAFLLTNPPSGNCDDNKILNVSPSKITDIDNFLINNIVSFTLGSLPTL